MRISKWSGLKKIRLKEKTYFFRGNVLIHNVTAQVGSHELKSFGIYSLVFTAVAHISATDRGSSRGLCLPLEG